MISELKRYIQKYIIKKKLLREKKVFIKGEVIFNKYTSLEGRNVIHKGVNINNSTIGFATYIGENCDLPNSNIGRFCSIAKDVRLVQGNHPTSSFVSTHPSFFSNLKQAGFSFVEASCFDEVDYVDAKKKIAIQIGNDVWIGQNVLLKAGIIIGDGSIIGAGSIVTKDIEPYSINVGVPSRIIRKRFKEEDVKFLMNFRWWDRGFDWINGNSQSFTDIEKFKDLK